MIHCLARLCFAHDSLGRHRRLPSGLILAAGIAALIAATPTFAATWTWTARAGRLHGGLYGTVGQRFRKSLKSIEIRP